MNVLLSMASKLPLREATNLLWRPPPQTYHSWAQMCVQGLPMYLVKSLSRDKGSGWYTMYLPLFALRGQSLNTHRGKHRSEGAQHSITRQIPQNLKLATVKSTGIPKNLQYFQSVILTGGLASKSLLSIDTQRPLSVNLAKLPIQKSEEFEVSNGKNYQHPKNRQYFFSRSVKNLVRMATPIFRHPCLRDLLVRLPHLVVLNSKDTGLVPFSSMCLCAYMLARQRCRARKPGLRLRTHLAHHFTIRIPSVFLITLTLSPCFFRFPCFFCFSIFLVFLCVFPLFSKDFRGSAKRKTLALLGQTLAFSKKQGLEGQGT